MKDLLFFSKKKKKSLNSHFLYSNLPQNVNLFHTL